MHVFEMCVHVWNGDVLEEGVLYTSMFPETREPSYRWNGWVQPEVKRHDRLSPSDLVQGEIGAEEHSFLVRFSLKSENNIRKCGLKCVQTISTFSILAQVQRLRASSKVQCRTHLTIDPCVILIFAKTQKQIKIKWFRRLLTSWFHVYGTHLSPLWTVLQS